MDGEQHTMDTEQSYPVLLIPKKSTTLETNCQLSDDVFIHLNITSPDTGGNQTCIYSGYCNIKILKSKGINLQYCSENLSNDSNVSVILADSNTEANGFNDQQIWIDPVRSPYVYNHCGTPPPLEAYEPCSNHITIQQHNMYITQNVYNEIIHYSPNIEEPKTAQRVQEATPNIETYNIYEEDELECGLFLSQLSEEIMNEKGMRQRDERKYIGLQTENEALKQLMSSDIQSSSKQQKTILFLGHSAATGQTIQSINVNDPKMECVNSTGKTFEIQTEDASDVPDPSMPTPKKKYQCDKCKQIFDKLTAFKQHMVGNHRSASVPEDEGLVKFMCMECGKTLKTQKKFEQHCLGHGDPELECNKCHKVFASKLTLRNHKKIHTRKYPCSYCIRTYHTASGLQAHMTRHHDLFVCESCPFICKKFSELVAHQDSHRCSSRQSQSSEARLAEGLFEDISDISNDILDSDEDKVSADAVIATVMSNDIFDSINKPKHTKRHDKTCEVCSKKFDRISDLKRHLIEHVVRSTLAKNPVDKYGALNISCEVCQDKVFNRIDRYKAHLREHAKLTLYKCAFCDKSFSDSSNFSKHKKIHSTTYYQCDMCQRKFNSKKMIIQHMELHKKSGPVSCLFCDRVFHFESMLNKHIRCAHVKENSTRFRCGYCSNYYKSLKDKWDHEWLVHQVRKDVADCLICAARFRKYSELKKHCMKDHGVIIPPAKKMKANRKKRNKQVGK